MPLEPEELYCNMVKEFGTVVVCAAPMGVVAKI